MRIPLFVTLLLVLVLAAPAAAQAASFEINSPTIAEGDSGTTDLTFTVTLRDSLVPALTTFSVEDVTTSPDDHGAPSPASATLDPDTPVNVTVPVNGDTLHEIDETLKLKAEALLVDAGEGTGTITDDDAAPTLTIGDVTTGESGNAEFPVELSTASGQPVTLNYATQDGTATAGADYTGTTGSVTFAEGETKKTVAVPVLPDSLDEPDETFRLASTDVSGGVAQPSAGTATIVDDDATPMPANLPPIARLSASPNPAYQAQVVVLDGRASRDPEGGALTYRWDIDGNGSYEQSTGPDGQIATAFLGTGANGVGVQVTDPATKTGAARSVVQIVANPLFSAGPPRDTTAPAVRLSRTSRSLRRALRGGIAVRMRCSEACVMGAAGTLSRSTSRRYRIRGGRRNLSKANRSVVRAGSRRLVLKFSRTARRRLSKARAARVTLRFQVTDPSGNKRRVRRSIRLRR